MSYKKEKPSTEYTEPHKSNQNSSNETRKIQEASKYIEKDSLSVLPIHYVKENGKCSCERPHCDSIAKHPYGNCAKTGVHEASKNIETVISWFKKEPNLNIGIATGGISGIEVLDIDPRNGGLKSLKELEERIGKLPETLTVRTGGAGFHYYFKYSGKKPKVKFKGIDFQSDGKLVVAPPSIHRSGQRYEWINSELELATLPDSFYEISKNKTLVPNNNNSEKIHEGSRNQWLASIAGKMRREGLNLEHIKEILRKLSKDRCWPPLPDFEVDKIAESICRYPPQGTSSIQKFDTYYCTKEEIDQRIKGSSKKAQMNFDALPLPIKKFREWAKDSTHAPDEFMVNGFIGAISGCMGKDIVLTHPLGEIKPHVWIANISESGKGKTTALDIAGDLLVDIEAPLVEERRKKRKEFKILYEKYLKDRKTGKAREEDEPIYSSTRTLTLPTLTSIQKLIEDLAKDYPGGIIYLSTELSILLSDWKQERNSGMIPFYLALFDSPKIVPVPAYKNADELPLIKSPAVSIVGASVAKSFLSKFNQEDFVSGNLQRWLIATVSSDKDRIAFPEEKSEEGRNFFKNFLKAIFELTKMMGTEKICFKLSEEAKNYWQAIYQSLDKQYELIDESYLISSLNRINDSYTLKFALIFECAKQVYDYLENGSSLQAEISKESVIEAIEISKYFKESLLEVVSKLETDYTKKMARNIINKLRAVDNKGLKRNDLKTLCNGFKYQESFDAALDYLGDLEVIRLSFLENNSNNNTITEMVWLLEE